MTRALRGSMGRNGEVNRQFGIYKNLCCGAEIVIPEGVTFPDCAKHIHVATEWKNITDEDRKPRAREINRNKNREDKPAA